MPPATESLADQVRELTAALEAARAALEGRTAELAAAGRALAERDAAAAEQIAGADAAMRSENSRLQAQQATVAAAAESAMKEADALRRALEEQQVELLTARRELADKHAAENTESVSFPEQQAVAAATAESATRESDALRRAMEAQKAELLTARREFADEDAAAAATAAEAAAAMAAAVAAAETAQQARQGAASAAVATVNGLASLRLTLEQWEVELAAEHGPVHATAGENRGGGSLKPEGHVGESDRFTGSEPASNAECKNRIKGMIEAGIKRREPVFVREAFNRVAQGCSTITQEQFSSLSEELGLAFAADSIADLFRSLDINNDGGLDLEEFKQALLIPSPVEQLIQTLPISRMISDAMPRERGRDVLRLLSESSTEQIRNVCCVLIPYLEATLEDAVRKLKASFQAMDRSETSSGAKKFEVPQALSAGTVGDFFGGLAARVGARTDAQRTRLQQMPHGRRTHQRALDSSISDALRLQPASPHTNIRPCNNRRSTCLELVRG